MRKFLFFVLFLSFIVLEAGVRHFVSPDKNVYVQQSNTKSKLSPNPAKDFTIVKNSSKTKIDNISILSIVGSDMISKDTSDNNDNVEINVTSLSSGKYFVKVSYVDGTKEFLTLIKL